VNVPVSADHAETLFRLLEVLDESDDVQNVVANFEVDDAVLERLSA
jgi:transcriptional/translational regulatory protein YebC/TACO1